MTVRTRYRLWIVCVAALIVVPHTWFVFTSIPSRTPPGVPAGGVCVVLALLGAMVFLIDTTPPDAIRLPPYRSVVILFVLTALLFADSWCWFERTVPAALSAAVAVSASVGFMLLAVRRGTTPWWVAPLWWHPGFVGPVAGPLAWTAVAAVLFAFLPLAFRRPELTP